MKIPSKDASVRTEFQLGAIPLSPDILGKSNIGLWAFELDEGAAPRMYVDDTMLGLIGLKEQVSPEETYHAWYDNIDDGSYDLVSESVNKMISGEHAEVQYPWHHPDGHVMMVRCGGVRNLQYTKGIRIEGTHQNVSKILHYDENSRDVILPVAGVFIKGYNIVYKVNITNDTFINLKSDFDIVGGDVEFSCFTKAITFFLDELVFEPDRYIIRKEIDYDLIREKLKRVQSYSVEYRILNDNVTKWHEMTISYIDDDNIIVGFSPKNEKILLNHLQKKELDDYYALFSVDLDTEYLTVLKRSDVYPMGQVGESIPFRNTMLMFAETQMGETRDFFLRLADVDHVRRVLSTENKRTYSYQSRIFGDERWVSVKVYVVKRHEDGSAAVFTLGFCMVDTLEAGNQSLQKKIKEQNVIVTYFLQSFVSAYYVGLRDRSCQILKRTEQLELQYPIVSDFVTSLCQYIDNEVHPDDRDALRNAVSIEVMNERLSRQKEYSHVFRCYVDGSERIYKLQVIRGADEDHAAFGFVDITDDVMEERRQKKMLEEALDSAQSASRAKTTFLNNMSHDIRTPMNAIMGYTALAISHLEDRALVQDYLGKIDQSSNHLLSLINDVLDMSRIESGKVNLEEEPESLAGIVSLLSDIVQADVQQKQHKFVVDMQTVTHDSIICDKLRLNQVLLNIISNSIKYTEPGGTISLTVTEKSFSPEGLASYEFRVSDNGIGMDKEFLKTMFDPFTRVNSSTVSGIQGTGLGMSITKSIIGMMNGKIDVQR